MWATAPECPVPAARAACHACCGLQVQSTGVLVNGSPCETGSHACVSKIEAKFLKATHSPLRAVPPHPRFLNSRPQPRHTGPGQSWGTAQGRLRGQAGSSVSPGNVLPTRRRGSSSRC